jgi:hypothetical protein
LSPAVSRERVEWAFIRRFETAASIIRRTGHIEAWEVPKQWCCLTTPRQERCYALQQQRGAPSVFHPRLPVWLVSSNVSTRRHSWSFLPPMPLSCFSTLLPRTCQTQQSISRGSMRLQFRGPPSMMNPFLLGIIQQRQIRHRITEPAISPTPTSAQHSPPTIGTLLHQ